MNPTQKTALPDEAADVLMTAWRIARDEQIRTLAALKQRLAEIFPKTEESVVDSALRYLAKSLVANGAI
jgi:hypothetical protein